MTMSETNNERLWAQDQVHVLLYYCMVVDQAVEAWRLERECVGETLITLLRINPAIRAVYYQGTNPYVDAAERLLQVVDALLPSHSSMRGNGDALAACARR